jgi:hypothetical protein
MHIPRANFYNSMWSLLPMRPECWLWSASFPNYYVIPAAGIVRCSQLSSSCQVRQHGFPFPAPIMVIIKSTGPLSSSWAGQDTNRGQHSSLLPRPLLQSRSTVHSYLRVTQNTWHPRGNIVKKDAKSFLLSSYLGPGPLATSADTATMAPPFILPYS